MTYGTELIAQERQRQIDGEGWDAEHDSWRRPSELPLAAVAYIFADPDLGLASQSEEWWPWSAEWFKPGDRERNLVKAGALIAAEIDRARLANGTQNG